MRFFAAFSLAMLLAAAPAIAQPAAPAAPQFATLNVQGDGSVSRAPDVAHISFSIVTNDDASAVATSRNNDIYARVQTALAPLGLSGNALSTTSYSVGYVPHPQPGTPSAQQPARTGYIVTRTLLATLSNLSDAGKTIDAAVASGVTSVGGVSFDLKDRKAAYREALGLAMNDARATAQAVAAAGRFSILRYSAVTANYQYAPLAVDGMLRAAVAGTPTSIVPGGPISITAHVEVTYLIK